MSKYLEMRTMLTDERYLVEALRELGYEPEVHREGKRLTGYMGDERAERAQIIIRRRQLDSASNDIGFARDASGVYQAIISEYDRGIGFAHVQGVAIGFGIHRDDTQAQAASRAHHASRDLPAVSDQETGKWTPHHRVSVFMQE